MARIPAFDVEARALRDGRPKEGTGRRRYASASLLAEVVILDVVEALLAALLLLLAFLLLLADLVLGLLTLLLRLLLGLLGLLPGLLRLVLHFVLHAHGASLLGC